MDDEMRRAHRLAAGSLVFLSAFTYARGEEYRNQAGHFRFQTPDNWVRFPPEKLAEFRNFPGNGGNAKVHEGFEPRGLKPAADGSAYPFMYVHEDVQPPNRPQTYDEIERTLRADILRGLEVGPPANLGPVKLDRARNRFSAVMETTAPDGVKEKAVLFGFFGKNSIIQLAFFAREAEFAQQQPMFERCADSFQFDPGFQFQPRDDNRVRRDDTTRVRVVLGVAGGTCCLLLVVVVGAVGIFWMMRGPPRRKKKKKRRREWD